MTFKNILDKFRKYAFSERDKGDKFEKLMQAHKRARVHKAYKSEIITFEFNLENNIINLLNNIKYLPLWI